MSENKLQTMLLYMTAEDLENALRQTYPEQFKDMPVKLVDSKFSEEDGSTTFKYVVYSDNEFINGLKGCRMKLDPQHFRENHN